MIEAKGVRYVVIAVARAAHRPLNTLAVSQQADSVDSPGETSFDRVDHCDERMIDELIWRACREIPRMFHSYFGGIA